MATATAKKAGALTQGKRGSKSKRTPQVEARLVEALKDGCSYRAACAFAGISKPSFTNGKEIVCSSPRPSSERAIWPNMVLRWC